MQLSQSLGSFPSQTRTSGWGGEGRGGEGRGGEGRGGEERGGEGRGGEGRKERGEDGFMIYGKPS